MSNVKVKVLGSGNAFNQGSRLNSSYVIYSKNLKILIDCGFTVPLALQQHGIAFNEIDAVLITHYHGDHFAGLAALLLALKYVSKQKKQLIIAGPGDVKQKVHELITVLYAGSEDVFQDLDIKYHSIEESFKLEEITVNAIPMIHSDESLPHGFVLRFKTLTIGFSGDTCWHDGVEDLINKSDATFLECNFAGKVGKGHISVEELEASKLIQTKKENIYLTHLSDVSLDLASKKGYCCIKDGQEFDFSF